MKLDATATGTTLTVTAFDAMHLLRIGAYTRTFNGKDAQGPTDAEIFKQLVESVRPANSTAGALVFHSEGLSNLANGYVLQDNETNYDFLMRRCREANYECMMRLRGKQEEIFVRGTVRDRQSGGTPTESAQGPAARPEGPTLYFKKDIEHISLDMRLPVLGSAVTAWGYDVSKGKAEGYSAKNASIDEAGESSTGFGLASVLLPASPMTVRRPDLAKKESLTFIAKAERAYRQAAFIVGEATLRTINFEAAAGVSVGILGVNAQFDGRYCVVKSMHRFDESTNRTVLTLRRSGK
jgi:phage protein D